MGSVISIDTELVVCYCHFQKVVSYMYPKTRWKMLFKKMKEKQQPLLTILRAGEYGCWVPWAATTTKTMQMYLKQRQNDCSKVGTHTVRYNFEVCICICIYFFVCCFWYPFHLFSYTFRENKENIEFTQRRKKNECWKTPEKYNCTPIAKLLKWNETKRKIDLRTVNAKILLHWLFPIFLVSYISSVQIIF